jgi:hypothetical protein
VGVACDAWLGTGLGGVAFALEQKAGRAKELTNGDLKSRMSHDQALLLEKTDLIFYTREQLSSQRGNWDLVHARLTEQDLGGRYGWSPRETRHTQPQGELTFRQLAAQSRTPLPGATRPKQSRPLISPTRQRL